MSDNWKKRWDLPSPDVAFPQGMAPGCGRGGCRFRYLGFHQNKKLLLNWVGQTEYLPKQGASKAEQGYD